MIQSRIRSLAALVMLAAVAFTASEAYAQEPIEWEVLRGVDWEYAGGSYTPVFTDDVEQLNETNVRIVGYMIPIAVSADMNHFLLSSQPSRGCPYCMPGGPSTLIEVRATEAPETTYDPLTVTGTLKLLKDDTSGLVYRIVEAEVTL
jgi:hypothetical protein